ncbi:MAG: twin arginine-targeting protein translocase TatC [Deltaproteobacteria bacterium RIFCSPLOWO2_02_FULL_44_10]|nr:MAG: twin arginine-targeting protein translocase TatC [Deltaproteobacteria bacterium RIFCSPHIGHO2_02_FULL_44_16]OGQ47592.1 MAG: twin arginine-targeting protein translocase TatC [Deltaproteobacteria bacterium RIFCSPLOWO2_02_FULL_44_10]
MSTQPIPLLGHLRELRKRILRIILILISGTGVVCFFTKPIFHWLQQPLLRLLPDHAEFVTLSLMEGWIVYFQVALIAGAFLTSPLWLYQMWVFLAPGLIKREKKFLTFTALASALCFILGGAFCYYVVMPYGFRYFIDVLQETDILLMLQMKLYLSFVLCFILAFGIVFELPIGLFFLVHFDIVSLETLKKNRRFMIAGAFVFGALLTPPDVISQICMAVPFIVLYEAGLIVIALTKKTSHS